MSKQKAEPCGYTRVHLREAEVQEIANVLRRTATANPEFPALQVTDMCERALRLALPGTRAEIRIEKIYAPSDI